MVSIRKLVPVDSSEFLKNEGYSYYTYIEPSQFPEHTEEPIESYLPGVSRGLEVLEGARFYKHQKEAIDALEQGKNVILIAGTGSGKTEAWVFYALKRALKDSFITMAIYPTLALANDQVNRIEKYASNLGVKVAKIDKLTKDVLKTLRGSQGLRQTVAESSIILTNPAFLLSDIKRFIERQSGAYLYTALKGLDLFVIDELDFYTPRSIALLIAMLKVLYESTGRPRQIMVMTATLANPEDMCDVLSKLNQRECVIIRGKPFLVENRTYLVMGKNMKNLWEKIVEIKGFLKEKAVDADIIKALEDFNFFEKNAYRVITYLNSIGYDFPLPYYSIEDILKEYTKDEGVTLVFTRSINRAEEIYRSLIERYPDTSELVAVHHHLIEKRRREQIEEKARVGEVRVIFSPKTLSQGIDIGRVVRVVHIGLPEEVREFKQREGRKGRRHNIAFAETIIIPQGTFDISLLSKGIDAFKKWIELPLEKTLVIPQNSYISLFTGIARLRSTWMDKKLSDEERLSLIKARILKHDNSINDKRLNWVWLNMNFYEYSLPSGIPRSILKNGVESPLEPIGSCDLVEKFQIGCFDLGSSGIVVKLHYGKNRRVSRVCEEEISYQTLNSNDAFKIAFDQYKDIKQRWNEEVSLLKDIYRARVTSGVETVVYPPTTGFGELIKIPNRVTWTVKSSRPRLIKLKDSHHVVFDQRNIVVPVNTFGEYRDFTTGIMIEAKEGEDPVVIRLGLAFLLIVLRRSFYLSFNSLEYSVDSVGGKTYFEIHEPESSGLLNVIDWGEIKKAVKVYEPDELDLLFLNLIDEIAWTYMLTMKLGWETIRMGALKVIDYLLLRDKIEAVMSGKEFVIPRPSAALKTMAVEIFAVEDDSTEIPTNRVFISYYDGDNSLIESGSYLAIKGITPSESLREVEKLIWSKAVYEGYTLVVPSVPVALQVAEKCELRGLKHILGDHSINKADISSMLEERGIQPGSIDLTVRFSKGNVESFTEWVSLGEVHRYIVELRGGDRKMIVDKIREILRKRAIVLYILYHILKQIERKGNVTYI